MAATKNKVEFPSAKEILTTRILEAPRELVFEAWTKVEHLAQWWGPRGFTLTTEEADIRKGGKWNFVFHGPDGTDYVNRLTYEEVQRPGKVVFYHGPGPKFRMTATFEDLGDKTRLTTLMAFESEKECEGVKVYAVPANEQNMERLEERLAFLETGQAFTLTRLFDAPRDLVWKCWTEPARIAQWFGPKGTVVKKAELDLKPDGSLHSCMEFNGHEMWGKWVFREIAPPKRLIYVNSFSDEKGGITRHPMSPTWPLELLTTVVLEEEGAKTRLTLTWVPFNATAEERKTFLDGMDGMKGGWGGSFDQLDAYLAGEKGGVK